VKINADELSKYFVIQSTLRELIFTISRLFAKITKFNSNESYKNVQTREN